MEDPTAEATRVCKLLVQRQLDRDTSTAATFAPFTMKWNEHPPSFSGRGEVTVLSRPPVTDQFVCSVAPNSDSRGYLRSQFPEVYAELVRVHGL
jgi:hypothetical protein